MPAPIARPATSATSRFRGIFIAQLIVMLPAFASLVATPIGRETVFILLYLTPVGIAAILFAAWQYVRHPAHRAVAMATAATPIVCLASPFAVQKFNDGPIAPYTLIAVVLALTLLAVLAILGRARNWRGGGAFANRQFNVMLLLVSATLLALLWFPIMGWLATREIIHLPVDRASRDDLIRIAGMYFIAVAIPALCLSLFALVYAPIGLARNAGTRLVHSGQLACALVTLTSLGVGALLVLVAASNPG